MRLRKRYNGDRRNRVAGRPDEVLARCSMFVERFSGKWSGSEGKTLSGRITIQLGDGRTLEGTFAVHAVSSG
jgi:hypothetical protein